LEKLIEISTDRGIPVLSIGIPDSDYLTQSVRARSRRDGVNRMLEEKSLKESNLLHYIPCPITFEENSKFFDSDGLHFSKEGYKELGKLLADHVIKILDI
jgi:lysophospholipase L1-like esterase